MFEYYYILVNNNSVLSVNGPNSLEKAIEILEKEFQEYIGRSMTEKEKRSLEDHDEVFVKVYSEFDDIYSFSIRQI